MAVRPDDLPIEVQQGELVTRDAEYGDMAIRHATLPAGTDMAPVLQGLPGDRCPSEHWGVVLSGSIDITHEDGSQELASGGELYHWPAGHTGATEEGVVFIGIGPTSQIRQFIKHTRALFG